MFYEKKEEIFIFKQLKIAIVYYYKLYNLLCPFLLLSIRN